MLKQKEKQKNKRKIKQIGTHPYTVSTPTKNKSKANTAASLRLPVLRTIRSTMLISDSVLVSLRLPAKSIILDKIPDFQIALWLVFAVSVLVTAMMLLSLLLLLLFVDVVVAAVIELQTLPALLLQDDVLPIFRKCLTQKHFHSSLNSLFISFDFQVGAFLHSNKCYFSTTSEPKYDESHNKFEHTAMA
uniref:Uncharacterized protein n=1 Tax=Glossina brevipalpis TaxID=37001 RepID=A0A1A9X3I0_9MUSC